MIEPTEADIGRKLYRYWPDENPQMVYFVRLLRLSGSWNEVGLFNGHAWVRFGPKDTFGWDGVFQVPIAELDWAD